jgi:hypothetical protein
MKQQVKDDWIINNQNIFGLQQDINLSLSSIQYEILNQIKSKDINSISDYLGAEIDISKEITLIKNLTIEMAFSKFLGFENINLFEKNTFNCYLILDYLQLSLFKEYSENKNKNILTFSEYRTQYYSLLNSFLASNIDTDEQDFIKVELTLCNNLINELKKPIYSVIGLLNEVLDKPCHFKKNLTNSIDKRKKFLEQKAKEKHPKIKALFQFIEYLHSNIENFNQYSDLIKELEQLDKKRNELKPRINYKDKQEYDEVQTELESKFKTLQDNTANLIKVKAKEFNVCNFDKEPNHNFNGVETEISQLKENFSNKDLPEIFKHKSLYLEYRSQTHGTFLSLQFFFSELDEITKSLFDFFKDTKQNEFEPFETKAIQVSSIQEAIKGFKQGQTKFILPNPISAKKEIKDYEPQQEIAENNDFIKSTIEDYLEPIKKYFNTKDYDLLVSELDSYFKTGAFTNSNEIIKTVNRPNKKLIGWQFKELYNNCINDNTKLSIEYLRFGKQRISIFKDVSFDESNYLKSNLYKYYNTKVSNT